MGTAIMDKEYSVMRDILKDPSYASNGVGGEDERTSVHTAVHCEDVKALDILLEQVNVDCNVPNLDDLTPLMFAAFKVKIDSFERLLQDPRVNVNLRTRKGDSAYDLLPAHTTEFQRRRALNLFNAAQNRSSETTQKRKVAILISNSDYEDSSNLSRLSGVKTDLEELTAFLEKTYTIYTILNARDIDTEVKDVMEGLPDSCMPVTHFQLVYSGIGP